MIEAYLDSANSIVVAIGWSLVHSLWQVALIGGIFAVLNALLKNHSPHARYYVGLFCMLGFVAAPVFTFFQVYQPATESSLQVLAASTPAVSVNSVPALADVAEWSVILEEYLPWIVAIWFAGVLLLSVRVAIKWNNMRRLVHDGTAPLSERINENVSRLSKRFGIRRKVQVLESALIKIPTVLGWLKPIILLPTSTIVGLSPAQLELVIAHELGHVKRYDFVVNWFQIVVETLLFYHPLVKWVSTHIREDREKCCDDMVINSCGNRLEYAKALANLESMRSGEMAPALGASEGQLLQRIERIVCSHSRVRDAVTGNSGLILIFAALVLLAGKAVDPTEYFEIKRNRLGDTLSAELFSTLSSTDQARLADDSEQDDVQLLSVYEAADEPVRSEQVTDLEQMTMTQQEMAVTRLPTESTVISDPMENATVNDMTRLESSSTSTMAQSTAADQNITTQSSSTTAAVTEPEISGGFISELALNDEAALMTSLDSDTFNVSSITPALIENTRPEPEPRRSPGPIATRTVAPKYPVNARIAGKQGYVVVDFSITDDGRVSNISIADSWPRRTFDNAAIRAIKGWRFDPASVAAVPQTRFKQRFDFDLGQRTRLDENTGAVAECIPLTGTRICRGNPASELFAEGAKNG